MSTSLFGQNIPFKEYTWDSTRFNHLVEPDYDAGSEHGYWPMSERQYNNLLPVRGFRDNNGGNYGDYVREWFDAAGKAPAGADEAIYNMFVKRREQLSAAEGDEDTPINHLGYSKRCVDLARELYSWACSAQWAEANGKPEVVVFDAVNQARKRRVSHEEPLGAEAPGRRLRSGRLCAA